MSDLRAKILIVFDDADIRVSLSTLMEREGFRILQASNGKLGLDVIRTASLDLMLIEIKMPDLGRIDFSPEGKEPQSQPAYHCNHPLP